MNFKTTLSVLFVSGGLVMGWSQSDAHIRLGANGEILGWLIAGPFPNVGALQLKGTGFRTDYLNGEAQAVASEGLAISMIASERATDPKLTNPRRSDWNLGIGSPTTGIDLDRLLNGSKPAIGYCYAELLSPVDRDAKILFGSDDGAKVFFNGQELFSKQIARGIRRDEDIVPVHLKAGRNRLLFKIEQGDGAWGLLARIVRPDGRPIRGLTESIRLMTNRKSGAGPERWVRASLGMPGSLSLESAVQYEEWSQKSSKWLARFRSEAASPEALEHAISEAKVQLAEPNLSADELSSRLSRFSLRIEKAFSASRAPLLEETQLAHPLVNTEISTEDYIAVMPKGRFFQHRDGRPFIPIGYNHNPDWQQFIESNPSREDYRPEVTDRYMAQLFESGVNVIRLMIETPPSGNLEDPIGTFSPEHVRWIDNIFRAARKHHVKLIVTPWDTFWMNLRWEMTPYNPALGGLVQKRIDFITKPEVRKQERRRLQFLIDRYGNTGDVFAWELLNEADNWWGASAAQLGDWTHEMAQFVRSYEHSKWGRNHLVSVSFMEPMPKGDLGQLAYESPDLDYATTHLYIGASRSPKEAVGPAKTEIEGVGYSIRQISDQRPYIDTENGPIDHWIDSVTLDDDVFLGMIWAHLASGGAGSGFRWPYRHPHHLTEGMLGHLKSMSVFANDVPWHSLSGPFVPITLSGSGDAAHAAFATRQSAICWSSGSGGVSVQWDSGPVKARCRIFDARNGTWIKDFVIVRQSGPFVIELSIPEAAVLLTAVDAQQR